MLVNSIVFNSRATLRFLEDCTSEEGLKCAQLPYRSARFAVQLQLAYKILTAIVEEGGTENPGGISECSQDAFEEASLSSPASHSISFFGRSLQSRSRYVEHINRLSCAHANHVEARGRTFAAKYSRVHEWSTPAPDDVLPLTLCYAI